MLQDCLKVRRSNPFVLATLAYCNGQSGNVPSAISLLREAYGSLKFTDWKYKGHLFPDPIVNLASMCIEDRKFEEASDVLEVLSKLGEEVDPRIFLSYPEIGWYRLYNGFFEDATALLKTYFKCPAPNDRTIKWLILSIYLSCNLTTYGPYLYSLLMGAFPKFSTGTALIAILVANTLHGDEQKKLHRKALSDCYQELNQIADELNVGGTLDRLPLNSFLENTIISSIDHHATGGKYNGIFY